MPVSRDWAAIAQSWVLPLWAMGVAVFAVRMAWGCGRVAKLRRSGATAEARLLDAARRLAQRMGIERAVQVLVSDGVAGPSVAGWLRPVILMPACAISGLSAEQLEAVLAHELAHIRRYDAVANLAQMAVETVLFYHPAVWWVSRRMRLERELCCDDLAVRACEDALCYARALTVLERLRMGSMTAAPGAVDGSLRYRIERIVGMGRQEYGASRGAGVLAAALVIAGLAIGLHSARAQQPGFNYLRQGDLMMKAGRNDDAIRIFTAGKQRNTAQELIYRKRIIEAMMRLGKRSAGEEMGEQILKEHPRDADALGLRAMFLIDAGKAQDAIKILEPLVKQVPNNPILHYNLGRAYQCIQWCNSAFREYQTAATLRPDYQAAAQAYANLMKQMPQAQQPASVPNHVVAAQLPDLRQGTKPASCGVSTGSAALGKQSGNCEAGIALVLASQPERASELVHGDAAEDPDHLDPSMAVGEMALQIGQIDLAAELYRKIEASGNPQVKASGYSQLARLYSAKGEWGTALESIDETIKIQPWNQDAKKLRERIERQEKTPKK
jgi:beta-lactamase regulating signal transducer with metallopeptidase domain/Tfp pilus assembly protein PilF